MLALELTFRDDQSEPHELYRGYIYQQGEGFTASASEEDIELYLRAMAETAQHSRFAEDRAALASIARGLHNGVNRFSYLGCQIVERQSVE